MTRLSLTPFQDLYTVYVRYEGCASKGVPGMGESPVSSGA